MTKRKPLALAALLLAAASAQAAPDRDLTDVARLALERDPQLRAARYQYQAAEERIPQARSLFLPNVQLQAGANRFWSEVDNDPEQTPGGLPLAGDSERDYDTSSIGIGLVQPLFRAESFTLLDQAKVVVEQADLQLALAGEGLLLRAAEAYFAVLEAQEALQSYLSEARAAEALRDRSQRALEVGAATVIDLNNAQARFDLVMARVVAARNEVQLARERLARLIGGAPGDLADLRPAFESLDVAPEAAEAWAERAREANLQVRLSKAAWLLARNEVDRQRAQRYPEVDLVARWGRSTEQPTTFGTDLTAEQRSVGVELSVPLYTGGAISSQIRQAAYEREAAMEQLQDARLAAGLAAETAYLSLRASARQVEALEQALESARTTEASIERGRELGLYTTLDVLDAQRDRYATERDLAAARYQHLLAFLQLKSAVGELDLETVARVNQYLAQQEAVQ